MAQPQIDDRSYFESSIRALEAEIANVGVHLAIDSSARQLYSKQIKAMSNALRTEVESGRLTWAQAARQAQETRNVIMELMRGRSTPVGHAIAEDMKRNGRTLNELIANKAQSLYGKDVLFDRLSPQQQNRVYAEIVESAGRSRPRVNALMAKLGSAGRGLVFISLALSVYNVANADDKVDAVKKEVAVTGAGIAGGIAGGALAGLACGPGAPVCVTIGAFVGGALAAFGTDFFW